MSFWDSLERVFEWLRIQWHLVQVCFGEFIGTPTGDWIAAMQMFWLLVLNHFFVGLRSLLASLLCTVLVLGGPRAAVHDLCMQLVPSYWFQSLLNFDVGAHYDVA